MAENSVVVGHQLSVESYDAGTTDGIGLDESLGAPYLSAAQPIFATAKLREGS